MANDDLSKLKIDKSQGAFQPQKRRKIVLPAGIILLVLIIAALIITGVFTPAVQVEVANVTKIYPFQTFTLLNASGYVVAQRKAAVASKITSRLISLSVEEGTRVKAGQVIARLEGEDAEAVREQAAANLNVSGHNLEQAQAELRDATLSFQRNKDLVAKGFISQSDYDSAEARYKKAAAAVEAAGAAVKAAKATLKGAEVALEYTLIRSPFDAVVLTKDADVGDIITPLGAAANAKAAVVTLADMGSLQVEADVSESNIRQVRIGQPCEIQLDALPDLRFHGAVHMIVPTADRSKATIMVKVRFIAKDERILPEMSAKVAFLSREIKKDEEEPRTALNSSALITRNGKKLVFLIQGNRVVETKITTGRILGDMTEVLSGVKAGDKVAIKPLNELRDGEKDKGPRKIMESKTVIVGIRNLVKSYRRGGQILPVLTDISLDVAEGEFLALMGPSGSGKTTLLNLIAGIDRADSGLINIGGIDITSLSETELARWRAANVGFIFQFYNLIPVLTAFENVELPLTLTGLSKKERRDHAEAALSLVNLSDRMEHYPGQLSGGQQQRVAIARAVVTDPTILVADEPTGDLDRVSAEEILELMERLVHELGKTIIMVTHDPRAAQKAHIIRHLDKGVLSANTQADF